MEKIFSKAKSMITIIAVISGIMFFLQSCCCLGRVGSSTQSKFCDCGKKNMAYDQGNKGKKGIDNPSQAITDASPVPVKKEREGSEYVLTTILAQPVEDAAVAIVATEPVEQDRKSVV